MCNLEWFGSITRTNAHFLLVQGKGVGVCQKVNNKNLKYKAEMLKLWGCNEDEVPTSCTLPHRSRAYQVSAISSSSLQSQRPPISSSSGAAEARGKHKTASPSSQPLADLFNMQAKDEADDAIGKLFFVVAFHST